MKRIFIVTAARSDYGILRPIIREMENQEGLTCELLVCGAHLCTQFGETVKTVERDGFNILARIEHTMASDSPTSIAHSTALAINGFAQTFGAHKPDALLLLGDRYEMLAAATAALPFNIPIIHIHGGEVTTGAIDDSIRHAISKMSHVHFTGTENSRNRLIRMGEMPSAVYCVGAPGLDRIFDIEIMSLVQIGTLLDIEFEKKPILATFHPMTRNYEETFLQADAVFTALGEINTPVIVSYPGADTGSQAVIKRIEKFAKDHPNRVRLTPNLDDQTYLSLMANAQAMVGNSSSGIIEAASFCLPVLNIGERQGGREHGINVIHAVATIEGVREGLKRVLSHAFYNKLKGMENPYGKGAASKAIAQLIAQVKLDVSITAKRFYDANEISV
jgi:UDP-hydrolysing UDP-N-acetyl-D-glucosamine 2-epimerase